MKIMVLCNDEEIISLFQNSLKSDDLYFPKSNSQIKKLKKETFEFIFADLEFMAETHSTPGRMSVNYFKLMFKDLWKNFPHAKVVVTGRPEATRQAVYAVKAGADNYLLYPLEKSEIEYMIELEYGKILNDGEKDYLQQEAFEGSSKELFKSKSKSMKLVLDQIKIVSQTKSTVLLTGESGTGKSRIAQALHAIGPRSDESFVSVHCGAIAETLVESELFGHEKGSFTGADRRKMGKFELANNGTIFLDEIGTISSSVQIKLLQVLQETLFQRVGGEEDIEVDVRIIAATNLSLMKAVKDNEFREDLFYRLHVFPIEIPPLRKRKEDIEDLIFQFIDNLNKIHNKEIQGIDDDVLESLKAYDWPGNVRELENIIERAHIIQRGITLTSESFPSDILSRDVSVDVQMEDDESYLPLKEVRRNAIENIEKAYLQGLLKQTKGKINITAETSGITTRQLNKLMNRYKLDKNHFK